MSEEKKTNAQPNNPLHGVRLDTIMDYLVNKYGWEGLALRFNYRCFSNNPTMNASLKFLRNTPWARKRIESLYLYNLRKDSKFGRNTK